MNVFHQHRWEAVAVDQAQMFDRWRGIAQEAYPITTVLYRCSGCGDARTKDLDGRWTLDQLTPARSGS